jgi:acyl dehydratase
MVPTQPFGQRIAHGTMTFAIGIGLTATQINPRAFTYGYERLRFPTPVHAGDTIRTTVTIGRKADDPKRPAYGQVVEICETKNQDGKHRDVLRAYPACRTRGRLRND